MQPRRIADEHALEHRLDDGEVSRVPEEVCAELSVTGATGKTTSATAVTSALGRCHPASDTDDDRRM